MTAYVTKELVAVGVQGERKITIGAESLPATFFANSEGRRATSVMENESLVLILEVFFDVCQ